jgi:fatty acid desaturase
MTPLFVLLAVVALTIFLTAPVWFAVGNLIVLVWIATMLYLIFYRQDPISKRAEALGKAPKEGGDDI